MLKHTGELAGSVFILLYNAHIQA